MNLILFKRTIALLVCIPFFELSAQSQSNPDITMKNLEGMINSDIHQIYQKFIQLKFSFDGVHDEQSKKETSYYFSKNYPKDSITALFVGDFKVEKNFKKVLIRFTNKRSFDIFIRDTIINNYTFLKEDSNPYTYFRHYKNNSYYLLISKRTNIPTGIYMVTIYTQSEYLRNFSKK